jgi:glycosyltransferase involved in cell wall biosynthesis
MWAQTFTDMELIVVDGGSTDETRGVVASLVQDTGNPDRYVYQKKEGPAVGRNTGIDLAEGRYLASFDSDDRWLASSLAGLCRRPSTRMATWTGSMNSLHVNHSVGFRGLASGSAALAPPRAPRAIPPSPARRQ